MLRRYSPKLVPALLLVLATSVSITARGQEESSAEAQRLLEAARAGEVDTVRQLIEGGASIESEDRWGQTPLMAAAQSGQLEVARLLLQSGADPDRRERFYGSSVLGQALFREHYDVAELLLASGASDREDALGLALRAALPSLARAAVESGPIYESVLERWRSDESIAPALRDVLSVATARPDPPPADYELEELHAFTGIFEGWVSDTRVEVVLREGHLLASVDGAPLQTLESGARDRFSLRQGELDLNFFGRAETVEGLQISGAGRSPESLRRSVAEPAGVAAAAPFDEPGAVGQTVVNWPSFRGTNANGLGDGADVPSTFDPETGESVLWVAELPGLGNSSPIVWGDRVFVSTAVAQEPVAGIRTGLTGAGSGHRDAVPHSWRVMAFDKATGEAIWDTEVAQATPLSGRHFKATQANSTPATDGRFLVAVFPTVGLVCLDLEGRVLWRQDLGSMAAGAFSDPGIEWGYASSPILYGSRVILQLDLHQEQYLAAWELATGELAWRTERDVAPSWATPAIVEGPDGTELVVNGSTIHGYDPDTGAELWSLGPNSELVIATPVVGDQVVFVAAGYPPVKPIYALRPGLRGELEVEPGEPTEDLLWSHRIGGAYMPTPLLYRGLYYVVHHNGRIVAYDPASGAAVFKERFSRGGTFTGSPVAANGKLFVPTEEGQLYVLEAGPEYRELAVNELDEPLMATPAVSEGILLLRTPSRLIAVAGNEVTEEEQASRSAG